ncbi:hypothetical protein AMTRI_Chr01g107600 [Amborella trichopoda]
MSTITVPHPPPSATDDSEKLREAFEGWGSDKKTIISILGHRNASQRKLIREAYAEIYKEDLCKRLEYELIRHFERAMLLWALDPAERDAVLANGALRKGETCDRVVLEIACARSAEELLMVRRAYHERFKRSLEEDIASHTTGDIRKLLVAMVSSYRYEGPEVNASLASKEAQALNDAIQSNCFNDEEVIRILSSRSKHQLNATLNKYKDYFGTHIIKNLKSSPEDKFIPAIRIMIRCIYSPQKYFEKVIRHAIVGLGTDEEMLTRAIITRAEVDLSEIKEAYQKRNSKSLEKAVADDTSGDYKDFLLTLLGAENL